MFIKIYEVFLFLGHKFDLEKSFFFRWIVGGEGVDIREEIKGQSEKCE